MFRLAPRVATGVGPSLHGQVPVFGVWPLRILDDQSSLRYLPPPFMLTARSRSRWNPSGERCSRFSIAVTMTAKVFELEALLAEDGVGSKERDDLRQKIVAVPYHVDERLVRRSAKRVVGSERRRTGMQIRKWSSLTAD